MKGSTSIISITFSFFFFVFGDVFASHNSKHLCPIEQRDTLLEFKNEFKIGECFSFYGIDSPPKTESWKNNSDCCNWEGIRCDAESGELIGLHLSRSCLHGQFHSNSNLFMLQNLHFLTTLDLSFNYLTGQIPSSIGKLSHLTSLTLSFNHFSGQIPSSIGKLSRLNTLQISNNKVEGQVPGWLWTLPNLVYLNLSNNTFTGFERSSKHGQSSVITSSRMEHFLGSNNNFKGEIPSFICALHSLRTLDLSNNNFSGSIPSCIGNLKSNLSNLNLRHNFLKGGLPKDIFERLRSLDVGHNQLVGKLPRSLLHFSSLEVLNVESNKIRDTFPFWLSSLKKLKVLGLRSNIFHGPIHQASFPELRIIDISHNHFNGTLSSDYFVTWNAMMIRDVENKGVLQLFIAIDFSGNKFEGEIPGSIGLLKELHVLNLSNNAFIGHIPSSMGNLTALESLDVSQNKLLGEIPQELGILPSSIGKLSYLNIICISNNKIKGQIPYWLWTLPNLEYLELSNNNFIGFERSSKHGQPSVRSPSIMKHLLGSNNNFTGNIPSSICILRYLSTLDLSENNFDGFIPSCLGNLKNTLSVLNLHQNRLSGGLPEDMFENLRLLDVGHNQLVGKLPRSLIGFTSLEVLNVESNQINDTFPTWLSSLKELKVLILRSNGFHGPIDQASFPKLRIIDISHNHFNGTLSSDYFVKWKAMSSLGTYEDQYSNKYMGSKDFYSYEDSMVLMNKGVEMEFVRILKVLTAIDFSGNKLEGEIPRSIGILTELHVLNLSNNAFSGHIPSSMGNLTALESLDVSQNKLSGEIPQEIGNLSYLEVMNFSHNQLSGLVPGGTQFRTQPCSSFEYNMGLFGPSLDEACRNIHTPVTKKTLESEEAEEEAVISWIAAVIGFGPGLVFGLSVGYILFSPYRRESSVRTRDECKPTTNR